MYPALFIELARILSGFDILAILIVSMICLAVGYSIYRNWKKPMSRLEGLIIGAATAFGGCASVFRLDLPAGDGAVWCFFWLSAGGAVAILPWLPHGWGGVRLHLPHPSSNEVEFTIPGFHVLVVLRPEHDDTQVPVNRLRVLIMYEPGKGWYCRRLDDGTKGDTAERKKENTRR